MLLLNFLKKKFYGFSIAEAMVVMLIVSITMAAAAPMLSKRNKAITGGNSKWMFTRNGSDITRTRGKVGIGVPTNTNPTAMLDIRHNTNDFIIVKKNNVDVFTLNRNGTITVNIPTATNTRVLSVRQNGTENAWINSNGNAQFTVANLYGTAGANLLRIGTDNTHVNSTINASGAMVLKPANSATTNTRALTIKTVIM